MISYILFIFINIVICQGGRSSDSTALRKLSFRSIGQKFSVPVGSDVAFPCAVNKQVDSYKMIFKYVSPKDEDRIFYAGNTKVAHFPRIRKDGDSFILSQIQKTDLGYYVCRFETRPLTQVVHKLDVLYSPKVWRESPELQKVSQGSNVHLQCSADGNPKPTILWKKQGGYLPSGAQNEQGPSLMLTKVDRHREGIYECIANNGIGDPVTESMTIEVEYPPEIISEQPIIHGGEGDNAELVCVVHGRPTPDVLWLMGGALVSSDKHRTTHEGVHRHTLSIRHVTEKDFGIYTCKASNSLGTVESKMEFTGLAKAPTFGSSVKGTESTSYDLLILTETSSPIIQYHLKYREVKPDGIQGNWQDSLNFPNNNISLVRQGVFQIKHVLTSLKPTRNYEVIVQVENKFGWSEESKVFKFQTAAEQLTTTEVSFQQIFNPWPMVEEVAIGHGKMNSSGSLASGIIIFFILFVTFIV